MDEINEIYEKLGGVISKEDFTREVEEKVEQMSGLCDVRTAAMLVAHDHGASDTGDNQLQKISGITPNSGNVKFIAKIMSVFPAREFNRNDGTTGRVANVVVADETGSIRLTLWDDRADLVKTGEIQVGQNFQIAGYVKEGYSGIEVNIGNNGVFCETDEKVEARIDSKKIEDIKNGMGDLNIRGRILDISDIRTFNKKDGSAGKVANIMIGDETGKIRVTLWDETTDLTKELKIDDSVEIINGYARENNFNQQVEMQVGNRSTIRKIEDEVEFKEDFTSIADIVPGESYSISGLVSGLGEIREFDRDDGTVNMVSNIYVSDDTGRIRIALWGDHALLVDQLDIDMPVEIIDAFSKSGFNDEIELSAGNRTRIMIR
ncbi:OB-fold nucleic acid binding domain-containing protein [Methanolobus mangrovi]|uniref:OB-fold nucleic acid binding domain-containing protein n=1 Tax=Methanolobus mangrovi TaxID=3072977 RepID=A0AA51UEK4_9EURY|nr:OB-fold nucleic acid binding domain-containing protein [Methanolobus mangrovi]WMW21779.1 OB-fold nucleic acid binding domain-containing protein [Methanolobus mangrovi]